MKLLLLTFKAVDGIAASVLKELEVPDEPTRSEHSQGTGFQTVPVVKKKTVGFLAYQFLSLTVLFADVPVGVIISFRLLMHRNIEIT